MSSFFESLYAKETVNIGMFLNQQVNKDFRKKSRLFKWLYKNIILTKEEQKSVYFRLEARIF